MEPYYTWAGPILSAQTPKGELIYSALDYGKTDDGGKLSRSVIELNPYNRAVDKPSINILLGKGSFKRKDDVTVEIKVSDPEDSKTMSRFKLTQDSLVAEVGRDLTIWSNSRYLSYKDINKAFYGDDIFTSFEEEAEGKSYYIKLRNNKRYEENPNGSIWEASELTAGNSIPETIKKELKASDTKELVKALLSSTRITNLVNKVLNNIDLVIPGMRDFITKDHEFMQKIESMMNNSENKFRTEVDKVIRKSRVSECDFEEEKTNPKVKIKRL